MTDTPCHILLIEDDPAVARLTQMKLQKAGHRVDVAADGEKGLARYRDGSYQALIVDYSLPGRDGLEVVRQIAAVGPLPPTIMVTGSGSETIAVEALRLGIGDYIIKDIIGGYLNLLPLAIERVVEQHRLVERRRQAEEALRASETERKNVERELAQAQKLGSIGRLAAGIVHEINTPVQYVGDNIRFLQDAFASLGALLGQYDRLLSAARENAVTEELVAEVEAAARNADQEYLLKEIPKAVRQSLQGMGRVASIVCAVGDFSSPCGAVKQVVDLNRAIENTLALSRNEWTYVANLVTDFDPNLGLVPCLLDELNGVVLNLVVDAAEAIAGARGDDPRRKGTITVSTRRDGDWAEIRVADTAGIPRETQVVDPRFTAEEPSDGTTQAPAVARSIVVERHGGSITAETLAGRGTTFIVRLPAAPPSGTQPETLSDEAMAV
jgi:signal transduction histidine kinase